MKTPHSYTIDLLRLVRTEYPNWDNFANLEFVKNETEPKREASVLAKKLLSRATLDDLLLVEDYSEFITRLEIVSSRTNLLSQEVPLQDGLGLNNRLDEISGLACSAIFELLYSMQPSKERLAGFLNFVNENNLPKVWTFPTYFPFLLFPETEIFIEPSVMTWFVSELDDTVPFSPEPNASIYSEFQVVFSALRNELQDFGARDMIDIQSLVWVAARVSPPKHS